MKSVNGFDGLLLVEAGKPLKDVRGGFLTRIIDSNDLDNVNYVLKTQDGVPYCAQLNVALHENRNMLLMMALDYGLPVTLAGDEHGNITGLAIAPSNTPIPSLNSSFLQLKDSRTGMVVRIVDKDPGTTVSYVLETADGARHCMHMWLGSESYDHRNHLFMMALRTKMAVTVTGGARHEVTAIAVGS
jgi:hypothetical protein